MRTVLVINIGSKNFISTSLAQSLEEKYNTIITENVLNITELDRIFRDNDIVSVVVFSKEDVIGYDSVFTYLKDKYVENNMPIYIAGSIKSVSYIEKQLTKDLIDNEYFQPFNIREMSKEIIDSIEKYYNKTRKTILVVDDSPEHLRLMQKVLSPNYDVMLATSGASALKNIAIRKPDLMLLDYNMPIVDGRKTLEMIRAELDIENLPVMFLTDEDDRDTIIGIMSLHPISYILKSQGTEFLLSTINNYFIMNRVQ